MSQLLANLAGGLRTDPLPPPQSARRTDVPHAPKRNHGLDARLKEQALFNALRYFPSEHHAVLAPEFNAELEEYGHIYMYRFRPTEYEMRAYNINDHPAKSKQAASVIAMIMNNLDRRVAQFPDELVTYGGNGTVFQNWAQYNLVMQYLCEMDDEQTLVLNSGHPQGLFPSSPDAPRVVVCNGMMIPNYSTPKIYDELYALGTTQYGQMTAGSFCYIGPQGIVHGTTLTLLNAARKYLGSPDLSGKVFVTAGLGGMSGAQPKAGVICGCIAVCVEVSEEALDKRHAQGWIMEKETDMEKLVARIKLARKENHVVSIGYYGNVVDVWERLAQEDELLVELGSDQTSCHNPYNGGYYPVGVSFEEANVMMGADPALFKEKVQESLRRHIAAINKLNDKGMKFWDYGNSFLLEASRAKADVLSDVPGKDFRYPSYVQDIMGDIFSLGFGPFRWVCTSQVHADLQTTDRIARETIERIREGTPARVRQQFDDNHMWITEVEKHQLVVGSEARILYADAEGRVEIAVAFNRAVRDGTLSAPVVLSRDHHDVSGTDSPWRETSHIEDGTRFTADMAIQNVIGDAFRGATWVSIHNGGGTGWGEAMNGGFGLTLDGSDSAERRARSMLYWDVNNGIARRAWACVDNAEFQMRRAMQLDPRLKVTIPHKADAALLHALVNK